MRAQPVWEQETREAGRHQYEVAQGRSQVQMGVWQEMESFQEMAHRGGGKQDRESLSSMLVGPVPSWWSRSSSS